MDHEQVERWVREHLPECYQVGAAESSDGDVWSVGLLLNTRDIEQSNADDEAVPDAYDFRNWQEDAASLVHWIDGLKKTSPVLAAARNLLKHALHEYQMLERLEVERRVANVKIDAFDGRLATIELENDRLKDALAALLGAER